MTARTIRRPAAAGTFYPGDAAALAAAVDGLLAKAAAHVAPGQAAPPKALVVPHAGHVYSGPVAASAYALVAAAPRVLRTVVLLGPAHFVPSWGAAVPVATAWATPLGEIPVDATLREVAAAAGATVDDLPHEPEHALEVQLPFLQRTLGNGFSILPVAVGTMAASEAADLVAALWGGGDTLVVVSTDLSHYYDLATARRLDRRTTDAVLARDPEAIGPDDACGAFALRGVLEHARRQGLPARLLDLRTSGDTAGDQRSVVGYGAFAIGA